ncbi:MAG TPA: WD40 repeat domain-containing protein, partial [Allocoleopsis sp.]
PLSAPVQVYFTPSEQTLVVVDAANRVQLWDLTTGQLRKAMGSDVNSLPAPSSSTPSSIAPNSSTSNSIAPNSSTPNSNGSDTLATPRNIQASLSPSGHLLLTVAQPPTPEEASLAPSLPHSATQATLWNVRTGEKIGNLPDLGGAIEAIQFSTDDTYVVTAGSDGMVRLWATTSGGEMPALTVADASVAWATFMASPTAHPGQPAMNAVFPPSSSAQPNINSINRLMALTSDGALHNWQIVQDTAPSAASPGFMHTYLTQLKPVNFWQKLMARFGKPSPDPQRPVLNASGSSIALSSTNAVLASNSSLTPTVHPAEFTETPPSPPSVASFLPFATSTLSSIASSDDAEWIATSTAEGTVSLYERQNNQYIALPYQIQNWRSTGRPENGRPENTTTAAESMALSPQIMASSPSPSVTQVSAAQLSAAALPPQSPEQLMAVTPAPPVPVKIQHLAFSADGKYLLGTADDFTVRIWEVASGQVVQVLQGHTAAVEQAQFSPNGEWVATASTDKTVRLWQTHSGKLLQTLVHAEAVRTVHFSPDGQRLVTTSGDDRVRVFDRSGQLVWMQYLQQVSDTAISPNGDLLVTADRLGRAYLWDAHTGKLQSALNPDSPDSTPIVRVFFSPDGQFVATQTQDGKLGLWAATRQMLLKLARERSPRQLTAEECSRYLNLSGEACPVLELGN